MNHQRCGEVHAVDIAEQEIRQAECSASGVDSVRLQLALWCTQVEEVVCTLEILVAEFEAMAALQPAQVLNNVPGLRNLVLRSPRRGSDPY